MGGGRKTQTFKVSENSSWPATGHPNGCAPARILRKSDLGGVIFGCNRETEKECFSKQLFGLPGSHFLYVRNIEPGLPLFLFNYSGRKLYGVFEAASHGQMYIDPYAWTENGTEKTSFPAQVRIQFKANYQYQPLAEKHFKPVLKDNYHTEQHFWFELDHAQVNGLTSLFKPTPPSVNIGLPPGALSRSILSTKSSPNKKEIRQWVHVSQSGTSSDTKKDPKSSVTLVGTNKWASLCDNDVDNEQCSSSKTSSSCPEDGEFREPVSDCEDLDQEHLHSVPSSGGSCLDAPSSGGPFLDAANSALLGQPLDKERLPTEETVLKKLKSLDVDHNSVPSSGDSCLDAPSSGGPCLDAAKSALLGQPLDKERLPTEETVLKKLKSLAVDHKFSRPSPKSVDDGAIPFVPEQTCEVVEHLLEGSSILPDNEVILTTGPNPNEIMPVSKELKEMKRRTSVLEKKQIESDRALQLLKNLVMESDRKNQQLLTKKIGEIKQLKNRVKELESKLDPSNSMVLEERFNRSLTYFSSEKLIYLVGGNNGVSWLATLESYSPSLDMLTPLRPMNSEHAFGSATALNGSLYVLGGGLGPSFNDTVECYNPRNDEWTLSPPLVQPKGSLAGATLNGKIYAIGGRNGHGCLSDVEMFDPFLGRWIDIQPMHEKRCALGGAEMNGVLYVAGGFDGSKYLIFVVVKTKSFKYDGAEFIYFGPNLIEKRSCERFDPREYSGWSRLPSMTTRRGCHSMAVLNGKLYIIGGHDGDTMVSSVEVFDPRVNSWLEGAPMNVARGNAAAAVLGESLYVIGGMREDECFAEIVELYTERSKWVAPTDLEAIGKRAFCSAVVL